MRYFRILIWKPKDQALVELLLKECFGPEFLPKKIPQQCHWSGHYMVGTAMMTEEIETKLAGLAGKKLKILKKQPKVWFEI